MKCDVTENIYFWGWEPDLSPTLYGEQSALL